MAMPVGVGPELWCALEASGTSLCTVEPAPSLRRAPARPLGLSRAPRERGHERPVPETVKEDIGITRSEGLATEACVVAASARVLREQCQNRRGQAAGRSTWSEPTTLDPVVDWRLHRVPNL